MSDDFHWFDEKEFIEASHGNLKVDYRIATDVNTGHKLKIIYSLDNIEVTGVGEYHRQYNTPDKVDPRVNVQDVQKNIKKLGNMDHESKGQKVLAIIDLRTGERLQEAECGGAYADTKDKKTFHVKVGEVETVPNFKSTFFDLSKNLGSTDDMLMGLNRRQLQPIGRGVKHRNIMNVNKSAVRSVSISDAMQNLTFDIDYRKLANDAKEDLDDWDGRIKELEASGKTDTDDIFGGKLIDRFKGYRRDASVSYFHCKTIADYKDSHNPPYTKDNARELANLLNQHRASRKDPKHSLFESVELFEESFQLFTESNEDLGIQFDHYKDLYDVTKGFMEITKKAIDILVKNPHDVISIRSETTEFKKSVQRKVTPYAIDIRDTNKIKVAVRKFKSDINKLLNQYSNMRDKIAFGGNFLRSIVRRPKVYSKDIDPESYEKTNENIRNVTRAMDWIEKTLLDLFNLADQDLNILTIIDSVYNRKHIYESVSPFMEMPYEDAQDTFTPRLKYYCQELNKDSKWRRVILRKWEKERKERESSGNENRGPWYEGDPPLLVPEKDIANDTQLFYKLNDLNTDTASVGQIASYETIVRTLRKKLKSDDKIKDEKTIGRISSTAEDVVGIYVDINNENDSYFKENSDHETSMNDIKSFYDHMKSFQYGLAVDGVIDKTRNTTSEDYDNLYRVSSPEQFEKQNGGICWDFVTYQAKYFQDHFPDIQYTAWYIAFDIEPDYPTHTFMTFPYEDKFIYFESSSRHFDGIYIASSEADIINFVMDHMNQYAKLHRDKNLTDYPYYITSYDPLDSKIPGCSIDQFMQLMKDQSENINHEFNSSYQVFKLDSSEFLSEASHGNLKVDHRLAVNVDNDHNIHIIYSLDGIILTRNNIVNEYDNNGNYKGSHRKAMGGDISEKEIPILKRYGNTDHESYNQKVLQIIDMVTGEHLSEVNVKGPFGASTYNKDNYIHLKVGEVDMVPSYKSTFWNKNDKFNTTNFISKREGIRMRGYRGYKFDLTKSIEKSIKNNKRDIKTIMGDISYYERDIKDKTLSIQIAERCKAEYITIIKSIQKKYEQYTPPEHIDPFASKTTIMTARGRTDPDTQSSLKKIEELLYQKGNINVRVFLNPPNNSMEKYLQSYRTNITTFESQMRENKVELENVKLLLSKLKHELDKLNHDQEYLNQLLIKTKRDIDSAIAQGVKVPNFTPNTKESIQNFIGYLKERIKFYNDDLKEWIKSLSYHNRKLSDNTIDDDSKISYKEAAQRSALRISEYHQIINDTNNEIAKFEEMIKSFHESTEFTEASKVKDPEDLDGIIEDLGDTPIDDSSQEEYYRIEYNGSGIYEELKLAMGLKAWKDLLDSGKLSWLPKPPEYQNGYQSWFTKAGYDKFLETTDSIIQKYLDKDKVKIRTSKLKHKIIYQDEYQVVVDTNQENPSEDEEGGEDESMAKEADKKEQDKNGVRRKKLYIEFIKWAQEYNRKNIFGSCFDKDAFHVQYPFVPEEMRYFYRLANPTLCVLGGNLTFFQLSELRKLNEKNHNLSRIMIFAATENDLRVFNQGDKKIYLAKYGTNGKIEPIRIIGNSFDTYIQAMINKGDILNGPID